MKKYTTKDMKDIAASKNGFFRSQAYTNCKERHLWQCSEENHPPFSKSPDVVINSGSWCNICSKKKKQEKTNKKAYAKAKKFAQSNNLQLLSDTYTRHDKHYDWSCHKGHKWSRQTRHMFKMKKNTWCRECCYGIKDLKALQDFAIKKGGRCLSLEYLGVKKNHLWKCSKGHTWLATPDNVLSKGTWCRDCDPTKKKTLADMQALAIERGGECESTHYIRYSALLKWKCSEGHRWEASYASIRNHWCGYCSRGWSEEACRAVFEQLFKVVFVHMRPKWLQKLELDGYAKELKIAFEHHGIQHYEVSHYSPNKEALAKRQKDDARKRELCTSNGVTLVEVPQVPTDLAQVKAHVVKACIEEGIILPVDVDEIVIDYTSLNIPNKLKEIKKLARERGGECLSEIYVNTSDPLVFRCIKGHITKRSATSMKKGHWCKDCAPNAKYTFDDIRELGEKRGWELLSKKYEGVESHLSWKCDKGHPFKQRATNTIQGHGCSDCKGGVALTLADMQQFAKARGGFCLSKEYINNQQHLEWKCSEGHTFTAAYGRLQQGWWCDHEGKGGLKKDLSF